MKREWKDARAKVMAEGDRCRVCHLLGSDAAHIIARAQVRPGAGEDRRNIVPLCRRHHGEYDARQLDLLPYLKLEEQGYAVALVGLITALERITGAAWLPTSLKPTEGNG